MPVSPPTPERPLRRDAERNRQRIPLDQREHVAKLDLPDHIKEIYSVYRTHS